MEKLLRRLSVAFLATAIVIGMETKAHAQGQIGLDNIYNTGSSTATTNGLFWVKTNSSAPVLVHQGLAPPTAESLTQAQAIIHGGTTSLDNGELCRRYDCGIFWLNGNQLYECFA